MRGNATHREAPSTEHGNDAGEAGRNATTGRSEHLHLRNYDFRQGYDLDVRIADGDGVVFEDRYYFQAGEFRSEFDLLEPGEYEVAVRIDNRGWETTRCRIGPDPEHAVLIELGNGIVSVTQGVY